MILVYFSAIYICVCVLLTTLLFISTVQCKWVFLQLCRPCLCWSVCLSSVWAVEKRLIGSGCCLGWWVG